MIMIIDFEASSLSKDSYPIEVAWGNSADSIRSHLINPETVPGWVDWHPASEKIHNISREYLAAEGEPATAVATSLYTALQSHEVYCDGGKFDQMWLNRLLAVINQAPGSIRLKPIQALWIKQLHRRGIRFAEAHLMMLKRKAESEGPPPHRAVGDVNWLLNFTDRITSGVG